ncbi:J domain-containing protein [Haematococcus lacustris]|uniref:J domain-containing protein n=1 Tax=Haematococcus lacustris TaxID=44745 RepID=A0A6A0A0S0_HAELA|nr:J domain-containing protein [Haematococcus lacustris]
MGKSSKADKKKEKESKKHAKKHKKAKSAKREASSSTSSSDADEVLTPRQQLARDKAAVVALRELLWLHAPARKELRDMLWTVDQGKAASIAGISDQGLRGRLRQLLKLLGLRGTGIKDVLALPKGVPATLSVLGHRQLSLSLQRQL